MKRRKCSFKGCRRVPKAKGFCHNHWTRQWRLNNPEKTKAIFKKYYQTHAQEEAARRQTPRNRYSHAKGRAKYRGLSFRLSLRKYTELIQKPCYYCNDYFPRVTTSTGLDRIDNNRGYTKDNVLPCCASCNRTRGDRFTVQEAKNMIEFLIRMRRNENTIN